MILFNQDYDDESLYDLERDVSEALCEEYNPLVKQLPSRDKHGFRTGTYRVTIEYLREEE